MNLQNLHLADKAVSANPVFKSEHPGMAISIQILAGERLAEHITKIPAMVFCISGHGTFENENGETHDLKSGDYVLIEPMVKHWIDAKETTQLVLVK